MCSFVASSIFGAVMSCNFDSEFVKSNLRGKAGAMGLCFCVHMQILQRWLS